MRRRPILLATALLAALPAAGFAASARSFSGATLEGSMNRPNEDLVTLSGTTVKYAVQPLLVTAATTCTFRSVQQTPGNGWLFLYETAFDPTQPLQHLIGADNDGEMGAGTSTIANVALDPTKTYSLVTTSSSATAVEFVSLIACTGGARILVGNGALPTDGTVAEFRNGRFQVKGVWRARTGPGTYISGDMFYTPLGSSESGILWTQNPNDWVVMIKVLDGCAINNRFWVFYAAATDIEFTITVTDTFTNTVKTYQNPISTPAAPVNDTLAFATCQ